MQIGMIGMGRMGANMVRRLLKGGHDCVAFDRNVELSKAVEKEGARATTTVKDLVAALKPPRVIWIMVPASVVDYVIADLRPMLQEGDILIDGGNSHYHEDIRRADELKTSGIHYVDVGTSGGVLGFEHGFCLMIGGEQDIVGGLDPIFATLAPGGALNGTPAANGYLHCGPVGSGHFVKMVHNGIEYGLMAAYAEGLNLLAHADAGLEGREADAETAPLSNPKLYQYKLDIASIAEVWRHGSIISSRLLDLTAAGLAADPTLKSFGGRVSDSGEGRWTVQAAIDVGVPANVLSAALYARFESRGRAEFADKLLSSMRLGFGGHLEKKGEPTGLTGDGAVVAPGRG